MPDTCYECGSLYVNTHRCPTVVRQIMLREKQLSELDHGPKARMPEIRSRIQELRTEVNKLEEILDTPR